MRLVRLNESASSYYSYRISEKKVERLLKELRARGFTPTYLSTDDSIEIGFTAPRTEVIYDLKLLKETGYYQNEYVNYVIYMPDDEDHNYYWLSDPLHDDEDKKLAIRLAKEITKLPAIYSGDYDHGVDSTRAKILKKYHFKFHSWRSGFFEDDE